ncbi:MAG: zinc-binding dehydrogenase [Gracilibacteraceae bacterium]|jgi:alcohol dehydrogenase (NADP+)|nr:zinc-binding dehydrogenase [Gracilibacteraceae bacterium]
MKAYAVIKLGKCGFIDIPDPVLDDYAVIVRTTLAAACTTDVHTAYDGAFGPDIKNFVLGHEAIGVVEEAGARVKAVKPGDKVLISTTNHVVRPQGTKQVTYAAYGNFAERLYVGDADLNVVKQPDWLSDESALMVTDMVSTAFSAIRDSSLQYGHSAAVVGIGPLGLSVVAAARIAGAGTVYAVGNRPNTINMAKKFGADIVYDYKAVDYVEEILNATNGAGVDRVFITGGDSEILNKGMRICKQYTGVVTNSCFFLPTDNLTVNAGVWGRGVSGPKLIPSAIQTGAAHTAQVLEAIRRSGIDFSQLVTHRFDGLENIGAAIELLRKRDRSVIKPICKVS